MLSNLTIPDKFVDTMAESMDTSEILPDEDDRKLFVGGLPQDAKQDDISAHFQTFGEIDNINLKTDPATGRSRYEPVMLFLPIAFKHPLLQRIRICGFQDR